MSTINETKASKDVIEKRQKYPQFHGEKLKTKLIHKFSTMDCIRVDEVGVLRPRHLKAQDGVVMDVTDKALPRVVPDDEVYHIGW